MFIWKIPYISSQIPWEIHGFRSKNLNSLNDDIGFSFNFSIFWGSCIPGCGSMDKMNPDPQNCFPEVLNLRYFSVQLLINPIIWMICRYRCVEHFTLFNNLMFCRIAWEGWLRMRSTRRLSPATPRGFSSSGGSRPNSSLASWVGAGTGRQIFASDLVKKI